MKEFKLVNVDGEWAVKRIRSIFGFIVSEKFCSPNTGNWFESDFAAVHCWMSEEKAKSLFRKLTV